MPTHTYTHFDFKQKSIKPAARIQSIISEWSIKHTFVWRSSVSPCVEKLSILKSQITSERKKRNATWTSLLTLVLWVIKTKVHTRFQNKTFKYISLCGVQEAPPHTFARCPGLMRGVYSCAVSLYLPINHVGRVGV